MKTLAGIVNSVQRRPEPGAPGNRRAAIETRISSSSFDGDGIRIRLVIPKAPRYNSGAPVLISVNPGNHDTSGTLGVADCGFIEVFFNSNDFLNGPYDYGGSRWIAGLRDVILFAVGRTKDEKGRSIQDLADPIPVKRSTVGLIGTSHGGNACGAVMALYGHLFPELAYYVSWESPYGEGAVGEELGSQRRENGRTNPAYNPETGELDLSKLAYDASLPMTTRGRTSEDRTDTAFRGSLFFDIDGDGRFDPQTDFRHQPLLFNDGNGPRFWYSIRLLQETSRRQLFGNSWPSHIPTVAEAIEFWKLRDATNLVPDVVKKLPHLLVIVVANRDDHMQTAPDHPHICTQVNAFQQAGARFIRLNPDRAYVEWAIGEKRQGLVDNPAGVTYDGSSVRTSVCPNEAAHWILRVAAACELADRIQLNNVSPNLDEILFLDAPRPAPMPERAVRPETPQKQPRGSPKGPLKPKAGRS